MSSSDEMKHWRKTTVCLKTFQVKLGTNAKLLMRCVYKPSKFRKAQQREG